MNPSSVFWSEKFWFPHNSTWQDMENTDEGPHSHIRHPESSELLLAFPCSLVLLLIRYIVEHYILKPLASVYGLKEKKVTYPEKNDELQKFWKQCRRPVYKQILRLSNELDWTPRRVERWFRIKRNQQKSSALQKFCEVGWRGCFYSAAFLYGVYVLYDEEFTYDITLTSDMSTWPHHHIKQEFQTYYILEMSFYISLLISLLNDVRRSDFYVHVIHHVLTIGLLFFSWTSNFVRLGLLVVLVHDVADAWVELSKLFQYAKSNKISDFFFAIFFVTWIFSRIFIFPFYILYNCWYSYISWYLEFGHVYVVFMQLSFMLLLFFLHLIWTYFIISYAWNLLSRTSHVDGRSASEESDISSGEPANNSDLNSNAKVNKKLD